MKVVGAFCLISLSWLYFLHGTTAASGKKGVSGWSPWVTCEDFNVLNNMSWYYDWQLTLDDYTKRITELNCQGTQQHLPEYVPMLWSYYPGTTQVNISTNAKYVLGFNEPDHADQANLTPEAAATAWRDLEQHSHGLPLVSPSSAASNFHWLDQFFRHCSGCRVDYIAAHSYKCNADDTMHYLQRLHNHFGKKIWLTEFGCPYSTSEDAQLHLMQTLLPRLEAADYVFRYSWFMARIKQDVAGGFVSSAASLFQGSSSTLTRLGQFYNDFQPTTTQPVVG